MTYSIFEQRVDKHLAETRAWWQLAKAHSARSREAIVTGEAHAYYAAWQREHDALSELQRDLLAERRAILAFMRQSPVEGWARADRLVRLLDVIRGRYGF